MRCDADRLSIRLQFPSDPDLTLTFFDRARHATPRLAGSRRSTRSFVVACYRTSHSQPHMFGARSQLRGRTGKRTAVACCWRLRRAPKDLLGPNAFQQAHCCGSRYLAWKDGFEALVGKGDNPGILKSPGERPAKQVPLVVGAGAFFLASWPRAARTSRIVARIVSKTNCAPMSHLSLSCSSSSESLRPVAFFPCRVPPLTLAPPARRRPWGLPSSCAPAPCRRARSRRLRQTTRSLTGRPQPQLTSQQRRVARRQAAVYLKLVSVTYERGSQSCRWCHEGLWMLSSMTLRVRGTYQRATCP
jgi:hypothetical protein